MYIYYSRYFTFIFKLDQCALLRPTVFVTRLQTHRVVALVARISCTDHYDSVEYIWSARRREGGRGQYATAGAKYCDLRGFENNEPGLQPVRYRTELLEEQYFVPRKEQRYVKKKERESLDCHI